MLKGENQKKDISVQKHQQRSEEMPQLGDMVTDILKPHLEWLGVAEAGGEVKLSLPMKLNPRELDQLHLEMSEL
jgi:hypothetical protein